MLYQTTKVAVKERSSSNTAATLRQTHNNTGYPTVSLFYLPSPSFPVNTFPSFGSPSLPRVQLVSMTFYFNQPSCISDISSCLWYTMSFILCSSSTCVFSSLLQMSHLHSVLFDVSRPPLLKYNEPSDRKHGPLRRSHIRSHCLYAGWLL